jgi:hypothetical protein
MGMAAIWALMAASSSLTVMAVALLDEALPAVPDEELLSLSLAHSGAAKLANATALASSNLLPMLEIVIKTP